MCLSLPETPAARNIAEWAKDQTRKVKIDSWLPELQPMTITSSSTGQPVTVQVFRVILSELDGLPGPWEWNIASKRLMALIKPLLEGGDYLGKTYLVTRQGEAPKTVWTISNVQTRGS